VKSKKFLKIKGEDLEELAKKLYQMLETRYNFQKIGGFIDPYLSPITKRHSKPTWIIVIIGKNPANSLYILQYVKRLDKNEKEMLLLEIYENRKEINFSKLVNKLVEKYIKPINEVIEYLSKEGLSLKSNQISIIYFYILKSYTEFLREIKSNLCDIENF